MNREEWIKHKLLAGGQTAILVSALAGLMAGLGWILAGPAMAVLVLGMVVGAYFLIPGLSPGWVLRMYQCQPLDRYQVPEVHTLVYRLAKRAELPVMPEIYYQPSAQINAFVVGTPDNSAIALSDGLLRNLNSRELAGVLGHEISHLVHGDLKVQSFAELTSRVTGMLSIIGQVLLILNLPFILANQILISWVVIGLLIGAPYISQLLTVTLSRTREYDADLGSAQLTGDPEGLASALDKIDRFQYGFIRRLLFQGYQVTEPALMKTHPPTRERVRRLLDIRSKQSVPLGESVFQERTFRPQVQNGHNWKYSNDPFDLMLENFLR